MGTSGMVAKYTSLFDVNADMVFFLFDESIQSFNKIRFDILWQNYQFQSVPYLCRKLPTEATDMRKKIISVTYICISLPIPNMGNDLVTELLLKSALSCPLRTEQFYANYFVSSLLSVSLHKLRFIFIFLD